LVNRNITTDTTTTKSLMKIADSANSPAGKTTILAIKAANTE